MVVDPVAWGDWGAVLHGKCEDFLSASRTVDKWLPVGAYHIISDPPYEQIMHSKSGTSKGVPKRMQKRLEFESIDALRPIITRPLVEICGGWILLFCTAEGVAAWRDALTEAGARYKRAMPWVKSDPAPQMNGQGPAHCLEMIVAAWAGRGHSSWNGGGRAGEFRGSKDLNRSRLPKSRPHKAEKPVWLMSQLVELFTQPGQTILDPFAGIGTTGVAAVQMGRRIIAIEKDREYAEAAALRIEAAAAQADMFVPYTKPKQEVLF